MGVYLPIAFSETQQSFPRRFGGGRRVGGGEIKGEEGRGRWEGRVATGLLWLEKEVTRSVGGLFVSA